MDERKVDAEDRETEVRERARNELTPQVRESVLKQVAAFAVTFGKGAVSLVDRIRGVKDPDAAISELDAQLAANRTRREPLAERYERLYAEIAAKKKLYLAAPPARKKLLELELKGMISEYQGLERQISVYLENERIISTVRGRTLELMAMGLRKLSEKEIDRLTDQVEDAVGDQEDVSGAMRDLEKAGQRREDGDADAFADVLAGFDETIAPEPSAGESEPAAAVAAEGVEAPHREGEIA